MYSPSGISPPASRPVHTKNNNYNDKVLKKRSNCKTMESIPQLGYNLNRGTIVGNTSKWVFFFKADEWLKKHW